MLKSHFIKSISNVRSMMPCLVVGSALLLGNSAFALKTTEISCPIFDLADHKKECHLIESGERKGKYSCYGVLSTDTQTPPKTHSWIGILAGEPKKVAKLDITKVDEGDQLKCEYEGSDGNKGSEGKEYFLNTVVPKGWHCGPNSEKNGFKCFILAEGEKPAKSKQ